MSHLSEAHADWHAVAEPTQWDDVLTLCRSEGCDGDADCGDSYDGYCPSCADREYGDDGE